MNRKNWLPAVLLSLLAVGCGTEQAKEDKQETPKIDASNISLGASPLTIERIDTAMMNIESLAGAKAFLAKHAGLRSDFLQPQPGAIEAATAEKIFQTVSNPAYRKFYGEVQKTFGNGDNLHAQFEDAFKHVKYFYPKFEVPPVQTVVSGLGFLSRDGAALSVSDSLVVVSLDFYAGPKASFVPNVPNFLLRKYTPEALVPSVMGVMAERFIARDPQDKSLLELTDTETHKNVIWAHFVKEKLLFETNHFKKVKYTGDRPYTAEIGRDCPGAIGRWLGWEIVRKYLRENPNVTLPQLLANPDAQDIFTKSKYKGE
ncbi:MAG: hypothetical protein MUD08_10795 [Cytophagales bacterium]|nr:hypothetical protein [Cytophagales bacterium]